MEDSADPVSEGAHASPVALAAELRAQVRPLVVGFLILTFLTGIAFPLALGAIANVCFPRQAGGSIVTGDDGQVVGSELIGQGFVHPGYFHPRPSAAGGGYDALASGGSNLGPNNSKLRDGSTVDPDATNPDDHFVGIRELTDTYRRINGLAPDVLVPMDAVTRSGSGLDPDISPTNAALQRGRVARCARSPKRR